MNFAEFYESLDFGSLKPNDPIEKISYNNEYPNNIFKQDLSWFLKHKENSPVIASVKSGPWEVRVISLGNKANMRKGQYSFYNHNFSERPARGGFFMDSYDKDIEEICGLSKKQYESLPFENRAKCNALIQLKKYLKSQFYERYLETYKNQTYVDMLKTQNIEKVSQLAKHLYGKK